MPYALVYQLVRLGTGDVIAQSTHPDAIRAAKALLGGTMRATTQVTQATS